MLKVVLFFFFLTQPANAFIFPSLMSPKGQEKYLINYQGSYFPDVDSKDGTNRTGVHQELLTFSAPQKVTEDTVLTFTGKAQLFGINSTAPVPSNFYDFQLGTGFTYYAPEEKTWGGLLQIGSASDVPFDNWSVVTANATAAYGFKQSNVSQWFLLVNYSNNRPFLNNTPLPGFVYSYTPSPELRMALGVPFAMIYWKFHPNWFVNFFTVVPWRMRADFGYILFGPAQIFLAAEYAQELFFRKNRLEKDHRFFYDEKKISLGFKMPIGFNILSEIKGGWAFDRTFFEASNYSKKYQSQPIHLGQGFYVQWALQSRF